jgi:hypothetical protein
MGDKDKIDIQVEIEIEQELELHDRFLHTDRIRCSLVLS